MQWECSVCGYVQEGDEPPVRCIVCDAPKDAFVLIDEGKTK